MDNRAHEDCGEVADVRQRAAGKTSAVAGTAKVARIHPIDPGPDHSLGAQLVGDRPLGAQLLGDLGAQSLGDLGAQSLGDLALAGGRALKVGQVGKRRRDGRYSVTSFGREYAATVAASCLLQPQSGDYVLVVGGTIIAVTERRRAGIATLRSTQPLRIVAPQLQIEAEQQLTLTSPNLQLRANQLGLRAEALALTAHSMTFAAGVLRIVAQSIVQIADRISSSASLHLRHSTVRDDVSAASASMSCEGIYQLRADAVSALGRKVVKLDGGQLQLG